MTQLLNFQLDIMYLIYLYYISLLAFNITWEIIKIFQSRFSFFLLNLFFFFQYWRALHFLSIHLCTWLNKANNIDLFYLTDQPTKNERVHLQDVTCEKFISYVSKYTTCMQHFYTRSFCHLLKRLSKFKKIGNG